MVQWMEPQNLKGDAIASILILAINIIGGLIIGIVSTTYRYLQQQRHMFYYQ